MRRLPWRAACLFALACASPALAQQGSIQVSAAAQVLSGDEARVGGQDRVEPDLALSWFQPGFRFGTIEFESHLTQRADRFLLGRSYAALRDVKVKGLAWTFEGGDTSLRPSISEYRFTNLFAPRVNFLGGSIQGIGPRTSITAAAGRATALRNIFGTDTEDLDQELAFLQWRQRVSDVLEFSARGSIVRTRDLGVYQFFVDESREAGLGLRYRPGTVEFIADASYQHFRRRGVDRYESDGSGTLGALWSARRGWLQVNLQRFSPGYFPVLNTPLADREGLFAAGEHDLVGPLRLFGGFDGYRTNLSPDRSAEAEVAVPRQTVLRAFGGLRARLGTRSSLAVRYEGGGREYQPVTAGRPTDSDTTSLGAEWQVAFGRLNAAARYLRRENVERLSGLGTYLQEEYTGQLFVSPTRGSQLYGFGSYLRRDDRAGGGEDGWQATAGGQIKLLGRELWLRGEATTGLTLDLESDLTRVREAFTVGLYGQLTRNTSIAFDLNADRTSVLGTSDRPWLRRSTLRLIHRIPTGSVRVAASPAARSTPPRARGFGSVSGFVYADWNGNGARDADEETLTGIALAVEDFARVATGPQGQFLVAQVPAGPQRVGLDITQLPVDYELPAQPQVEVDVPRNRTATVTFGLVPLGSIRGQVFRDRNDDGRLDAGDEPVDDAVVSLDAGARSELARGGRFRFDAVPVGAHRVRLLVDSLPQGAEVIGDPEVTVQLARGHLDDEVVFLIKLESRPEIRRVFAPSAPVAAPARPEPARPPRVPPVVAPAPRPAAPAAVTPEPVAPAPAAPTGAGPFVIQIAAMSRLDSAQSIVGDLRGRGYDAWIVQPGADRPGDFYRVRAGAFTDATAANRVIQALSAALGVRPVIAGGVESAPFRIQVAALADEARARAIVERLAGLGYNAYVLPPTPAGADALYRVRTGAFPSRDQAEPVAAAIQRAIGSTVWITQDHPAIASASRVPGRSTPGASTFALQLGALAQSESAQVLLERARAAGYEAYVIAPEAGASPALYRVRIGGYRSRAAASAAAAAVEQALGVKPWVTAESAVPRRSAPLAPAGPFIVQIGAFSTAQRAGDLVARVRALGYEPYLRTPAPGDATPLFRVGVGPLPTLAEAQAVARALEAALGSTVWITKGE